MKIQPADTSYTPPIRHGKTAQNGGSTEVPAFQFLLVNTEKSSAAKDILADYDLHNINWNEINTLGRKLDDAGVFDGEQMLNFSAPHFGKFNGVSLSADEKNDYPATLGQAIASVKRSNPSDVKSIQHLEKVEQMLLNLFSLQSGSKGS